MCLSTSHEMKDGRFPLAPSSFLKSHFLTVPLATGGLHTKRLRGVKQQAVGQPLLPSQGETFPPPEGKRLRDELLN